MLSSCRMQPPEMVKNSSGIFHRLFLCILTLLWFNLQLNGESRDYEICYSSPWKPEWIKSEGGSCSCLSDGCSSHYSSRLMGRDTRALSVTPWGGGGRRERRFRRGIHSGNVHSLPGDGQRTANKELDKFLKIEPGVKRRSCAPCVSIFLGMCAAGGFSDFPCVLQLIFWVIHKHARW